MFWYLHQSQWLNTFFEIKSSSLIIISVIDWRGSCWCCWFPWSWPTVCSGFLLQYKIFFGQFPKSGVQAFDQTLCNFNWIFSKHSHSNFPLLGPIHGNVSFPERRRPAKHLPRKFFLPSAVDLGFSFRLRKAWPWLNIFWSRLLKDIELFSLPAAEHLS